MTASMFANYPEIPENAPEDEVPGADDVNSKILKRLKKNAKLLKKILKNQRESERPQKSEWWSKMADVIFKAIPRVLINIATEFFKGIFSSKKNRLEA